jgi:hypothetical protein
MTTPSQSDLSESPEKVIRRRLGGPAREGETKWQPRLDPLLAILGQLIDGGRPALVVSPGEDCRLLRDAMAGRWHYPRDRNGQVSRELPEKDHPWPDLGDSLLYTVSGAKPCRQGRPRRTAPYRAKTAFNPLDYDRTRQPSPQNRGWDL